MIGRSSGSVTPSRVTFVDRFDLEPKRFGGGFETVGLFVDDVRELFGLFREFANRHLFDVLVFDLAFTSFEALAVLGTDVGDVDDVVAEFDSTGPTMSPFLAA